MVFGFGKKQNQSASHSEYLDAFLALIPEYCVDKERKLIGAPEHWQPRIVSYSLYLGLGVGALDEDLHRTLLAEISPGIKQTSDLVIGGLNVVRDIVIPRTGEVWSETVGLISNFMSMSSPETTGPRANEALVKQRAPISGFIPGLRLMAQDRSFAKQLYTDALDERRRCCEEELATRIAWMKQFVEETL